MAHNEPSAKPQKYSPLKKFFKDYFSSPKLSHGEALNGRSILINNPYANFNPDIFKDKSDRDIRRIVQELTDDARLEEHLAISREELKLAKEVNQASLVILHRSQVISLLALLVAIAALVLSFF